MSLITRIFMAIAIVAGLASLYAGWTLKARITEQLKTIQEEKDDIARLTKESAEHKKDAEETHSKLKDKEKMLGEAQSEIEKTKNELTSQVAKTKEVEEKLAQVSEEASKTKAEVEKIMKALPEGMTFEQVRPKITELQEQFATLDQEKKVLNEQLDKMTVENKKLQDQLRMRQEGKMPKDLTGHVLAVNKEWNFVVLDIGADQGVLENAPLIVYRDGKLIGKVKITSMEPSISVADILPGSARGEIQEGDLVTP